MQAFSLGQSESEEQALSMGANSAQDEIYKGYDRNERTVIGRTVKVKYFSQSCQDRTLEEAVQLRI